MSQHYSSAGDLPENLVGNSGKIPPADIGIGEEDQMEAASALVQVRQFSSRRREVQIADLPEPREFEMFPIPRDELMPYAGAFAGEIEYLPPHIRLHHAAAKGDWRAVKSIIDVYPPAVRVAITGSSETILHIAVASNHTAFVDKLIGKMTSDDLALRNSFNNTALCFAAASVTVGIAKMMVNKNQKLPLLRGHGDVTPLLMAMVYKRKDLVSYLFSVTDFQFLYDEEQVQLFIASISADYYDIALQILDTNPYLATRRDKDGETALHVMARKPSAIGSKNRLNIWEKSINFCIKGIYKEALMKTLARELIKCLWSLVLLQLPDEEEMLEWIVYPTSVVHEAARVENVEFLIVLISSYPDLVWKVVSMEQKSFLHVAVENRHESVFSLIHEIGGVKDVITSMIDEENYNILHLAAKMAAPHHRKDGEEWMKSTANSCMLVATLIATVVFAAAFTVPGGSDSNTGVPVFQRENWFTVFVISDAVALVSSTTSILIFLSILTSRFAEDDFLHSLPSRLRSLDSHRSSCR